MSSSDFRQIAFKGETTKAGRLFRAAVSAFCSLTRPSRRDIAQLEDLTLPLFQFVSVETRRYVAAALSECEYAPKALIMRLCDEPVEIAAPLLIRSNALSDIDLIALIGRHGLGHARAIARRPGLHPTIANLIAVLNRKIVRLHAAPAEKTIPEAAEATGRKVEQRSNSAASAPVSGIAAENARRRLRSMMRPSEQTETTAIYPFIGSSWYARLRETALTGNAAFFQTALADALEIDFVTAQTIVTNSSNAALIAALRALDLTEEQAFLIAAAVRPTLFSHPESIRLFLGRFRLLHPEAALDRVRGWKAEAVVATMGTMTPQPPDRGTATSAHPDLMDRGSRHLRAS